MNVQLYFLLTFLNLYYFSLKGLLAHIESFSGLIAKTETTGVGVKLG